MTGGNGQVGRALRPLLPTARYATRDELDVTDRAQVHEAIAGVDVVVHLAAMTDVDRCEREPGLAEEVNGAGSRNVAAAARTTGARVIGVSTDYVFDGTAPGEYTEADEPRPLSAYGRTKLAGELALLEAGDNTVIRTSWVYGDGRNFIRTILHAAASGRALAVVDDQAGRPTAADDVARAIVHLLPADSPRLVHVTGDGPPTSWAGVAEQSLAAAGLAVPVEHVSTIEYGRRMDSTPAPRPSNSLLSLECARGLGVPLSDWRTSVSAYARGTV
ncbi:MAG TPA: dTDP-4-dehydrorhamnose reductase [Gaiellales bacterium]|nr:dTDP-4-dehydrorhamnose reductase [Gaiellales bacterium]